MNIAAQIARRIFILPIIIYQKVISPALPSSCIYEPSCSHYASQAILNHGLLKGLALGVSRIFRCVGGLFIGGTDAVPEEFSFRSIGDGYRKFWRGREKS